MYGIEESEDQCFQALDWKCAFKTAVCFPGNHHAALGVANKTNCNVVDCWDVMIRKGRKVEKCVQLLTQRRKSSEGKEREEGGMVDHHHQGEKAPRSVAAPSWRRENSKGKE